MSDINPQQLSPHCPIEQDTDPLASSEVQVYAGVSRPRPPSWLVAFKSECFPSQSAWLTFTFNNTYHEVFYATVGNTICLDILLSCFLALCHRRNATAGRQTRDVIGGYQISTQYSFTPFLHVVPLVVVGFTTCPE